MNYYKEHQLVPRMPSMSLATDTLMINDYLHLNQVASQLNVDIYNLRELNPVYRRDVVPATNEKPLPLRMPVELVAPFIDRFDAIYAYERESFFPDNKLVVPSSSSGSARHVPIDIRGKTPVSYTVKSGDTPGHIARWFNVRLDDLRDWNNLSRNLIRVGQRLTIYVPEDKKTHYERVNLLSFNAKQELVGQPVTANVAPISSSREVPDTSDGDFEYYTVRSGDNLWNIAQRFPGVSNQDIMRLNNITNERSLRVGQRLRIRPKT
jgi:membrane-bound lytic murein transglycosylase D